MKRLKGPELKMPEVKVPSFLQDLYWDLRDRRLLPLVGVIIVAIVAVPFVFGAHSDSESAPEDESSTASISAQLENARASDLVVVKATPGLRDYHKRLANRTPKDPFSQPAQTPRDTKGAQIEITEGTSASNSAEGEISATPSGSGGEAPEPSGSDSGPSAQTPSSPDASPPSQGSDGNGKNHLTFYTFAIDARITHTASKSDKGTKAEPVVQERILPLTALPGEKAPVVTYMGASKKGKALLMVSNDVKSVFGETKCISGDDVCQLLEAEPGFPATFIYGNGESHYTIKVLKIYPVVTGRN